MHCIEYKENLREKWNNFVAKNPQADLYHDISWKKVLEKTFLLKSHYLICIDDSDEIIGILPLFEIKDILGKVYLVSIPFFTNAGICVNREDAATKLLDKASEIAESIDVQYVELRHLTKQSINGLKSRRTFATSILKLNSDENAVWNELLSDMVRRNIRKAQRFSLKVSIGREEELAGFYRVYAQNMRDLGTPAMPLNFFKSILNEFPSQANILVIKKDKETIACMILIRHKATLYDPFVSSIRKYNPLRPNNLLYWEAIKSGCRSGLSYFDLGRSTIGTGLFNFKSQWGASSEQLSYQYLFNKSSQMPVCDAVNNKYKLAIEIWKRLPLCLTNYIGPRLIPYLPEL